MTTLAFSVAGAAIGSFFPGGTAVGWVVGGMIGNALFPQDNTIVTEGARLGNLDVTSNTFGLPISRHFGRNRIVGQPIWTEGLREQKKTEETGGKGGSSPSQEIISYTYSLSFAVAFCAGPMLTVRKIWLDSILVYDETDPIGIQEGFVKVTESEITSSWYAGENRIQFAEYLGTETQEPDPLIEAIEGAGLVPAHRGICYVVFENVPLAKWGNRMPLVTAEVISEGDTDPCQNLFQNNGSEPAIYDAQIHPIEEEGIITVTDAHQCSPGLSFGGGKLLKYDKEGNLLTETKINCTDLNNVPKYPGHPSNVNYYNVGWFNVGGDIYHLCHTFLDIHGVSTWDNNNYKTGETPAGWPDAPVIPVIKAGELIETVSLDLFRIPELIADNAVVKGVIPCEDLRHCLISMGNGNIHMIKYNGGSDYDYIGVWTMHSSVPADSQPNLTTAEGAHGTYIDHGSSVAKNSTAVMEADLYHVWGHQHNLNKFAKLWTLDDDGFIRDKLYTCLKQWNAIKAINNGGTDIKPGVWCKNACFYMYTYDGITCVTRLPAASSVVTLAQIVSAVCTDAEMPADAFDVTDLQSVYVDGATFNQESGRTSIKSLQSMYQFDGFESMFQLIFKRRTSL